MANDQPTTKELVAWLREKQAAYNMPATDQLPQFKRSEAMYKAAAERLESLEAEVEAKHVETIDGWDLPSAMNRIDELETTEIERLRKADLAEAMALLASTWCPYHPHSKTWICNYCARLKALRERIK